MIALRGYRTSSTICGRAGMIRIENKRCLRTGFSWHPVVLGRRFVRFIQ